MSVVKQFAPDPEDALAPAATRPAAPASNARAGDTAAPAASPALAAATAQPASSAPGTATKEAKKTRAERAADIKAEREKDLKELATRKAGEIKVFTTGSYLEAVEWRRDAFSTRRRTTPDSVSSWRACSCLEPGSSARASWRTPPATSISSAGSPSTAC